MVATKKILAKIKLKVEGWGLRCRVQGLWVSCLGLGFSATGSRRSGICIAFEFAYLKTSLGE